MPDPLSNAITSPERVAAAIDALGIVAPPQQRFRDLEPRHLVLGATHSAAAVSRNELGRMK